MEHLRDDVRATATHDPANISSKMKARSLPSRASQCQAASYSLRDNLADE